MKPMIYKCITYLKEIGIFGSIVGGCMLIGTIVLNFQAFVGTVQDSIRGIPTLTVPAVSDHTKVRLGSIDHPISNTKDSHPSADTMIGKEEKKVGYHKDLKHYLSRQFKNIKLSFNLLPPDNYLIIPEIGVQVRLVDTHMVSSEIIAHGDFESYLQQGVVKYPATPDPGTAGNSLLFGHTSLEPWKLAKNKYGTIFRNIPKLREGSSFTVVRNGEQYDYKVIKKEIKKPQDVKAFYAQYGKENSYVSLMGCYPIGSDAKRMVVVGALQDRSPHSNATTLVAYHH